MNSLASTIPNCRGGGGCFVVNIRVANWELGDRQGKCSRAVTLSLANDELSAQIEKNPIACPSLCSG
jgi:hypothetical protein